MSTQTDTSDTSNKPKIGFIKLVLIMFVVILIAVLIITQMDASEGAVNFSYDGLN